MIFIKKYFLFTVGRDCRVSQFKTGSRNALKVFRKSHIMPDQVRKWLRQKSKDLYAVGFEALVKRWDKCINFGGGYVEIYMFLFQVPISHDLRFMFICDLFTDSPTYLRAKTKLNSQLDPSQVSVSRFAHFASFFTPVAYLDYSLTLTIVLVRPSETLVNFYRTTWRHISYDYVLCNTFLETLPCG
jgi:hypothetical protein